MTERIMGPGRLEAFSDGVIAILITIMVQAVERQFAHDPGYRHVGRRAAMKNYISIAFYAASVPLAFVHPAITLVLCFAVAAISFLPNAWLGEHKA